MITIGEHIVNVAKKYIGVTELKSNSGFVDAEFEKRMKQIGWKSGESWCSYFCELVWREAYDTYPIQNDISKELLDKLFSGSATATFKNFDQSNFKTRVKGDPKQPIKTPALGALGVFRYGNDWTGHITICTGFEPFLKANNRFQTVEGNTNKDGSREGIEVAERTRYTNNEFSPKGLNFIGFILPIQP